MSSWIVSSVVWLASVTALQDARTPTLREPVAPELPDGSARIDLHTARRILELFDRASSAEELCLATGIDAGTATAILEARASRPGATFARFDELDAIWRRHPRAFPQVYAMLGPPAMGMWETLPYVTPLPCAHSVLLHSGLVLMLPENERPVSLLWDPSDLEQPIFLSPANAPPVSVFCSGHAQLSDGRIFFGGGSGREPTPDSIRAFTFDPAAPENGRWANLPPMHYERWYATVVALGGGRVLVVGGANAYAHAVRQMEVYDEATNAFTVVTGPSGDPQAADLRWSELYPGLHLLPTGDILFTRTGSNDDDDLGTRGKLFTWTDPLHPTSGAWRTTGPMVFPDRTEGFSVQLPIRLDPELALRPRVAVFGGGDPVLTARRTVEVYEGESAGRTAWVRKSDMAEPRNHSMGVLLPDGSVLVMGGLGDDGGGLHGSHSSELYDPATGTLARQDDVEFARGYHSMFALLPSGQVMMGGGQDHAHERILEVFSPPYLFRGPRPRITSAPAAIRYGSAFTIASPDAARIERAVLVRPIASTHNTDTEQRLVQLACERGRDQVTIKAPGGTPPFPNAPSGYYMLFVLDSDGVPSTAKFVRLE